VVGLECVLARSRLFLQEGRKKERKKERKRTDGQPDSRSNDWTATESHIISMYVLANDGKRLE